MAAPARFDPFSDSFDEAFRRIFGAARWDVQGATTDIKVAVWENEEADEVNAEIPRLKNEDINVRIDGDAVAISGERHDHA